MGPDGTAHPPDEEGAHAPRSLLPATQRERLVDGMARAVAAQGYTATAVADVLRESGVSRRTFYERFSDKEDCFLAAYDLFAEVALERVRAACEAAEGTADRDELEAGIDALLQLLAEEPAYARLSVVEVLAAGPRGLARRDEMLRCFTALVQSYSDRHDAPAPPPDLVAQAIVGGINELLYSHIVRGETDRLPELTAEMLHYTFMLLGLPRRTV